MIIDTLQNASKYACLHPLLAKAFVHIQQINFDTILPGKYAIDGDQLRAIISLKNGTTAEASLAKFECHDKHIDIQLCIHGEEQIGWKPREKCVLPNGAYNTEKDKRYFYDEPDIFFKLTDGQFVLLFPEDVHAPMIGETLIKKLVIKVKI